MDKLKPILAQKFWILSGICLILALAGWWISTAGQAAEITKRIDTLKKAYTSIPQPGPNENWTKRVKAYNAVEEKKVTETGEYLWNNQLPLMVWPETIRPGVEKAGYRGEIDAKTRGEFRYVYDEELLDLLAIVEPLNPLDGTGKVQAASDLIPNLNWGTSPNPPSSKEMWDTQEDIWLYTSLLTAIANVNNQFGSVSIVDSKIKEITKLELRGGTVGGAPKAAAASAGGAPGPGGAGGPMVGMPEGMMKSKPGGGGNLQMGGAGGDSAMSASFDPAEQLGSDDDPSGGGAAPGAPASGGAPPTAGPPGGPAAPPAGGPPGMPKGMASGAMGNGTVPRKRYIEETPRYKTRGFYMELVMDHRELPEFLSELSDSRWPLRVIRVQQVDRDTQDVNSSVVGAAGGAMTMGGGNMGGGMSSAAKSMSMMSKMQPRKTDDDDGGAVSPRLTGKGAAGDGGSGGDSAVDLQVAMSDPYLVNVAISGIITLYLPPAPAAGAPGTPPTTPAGPTPPGATTPAGPTPPAATTPGATTPPATAPATTTPGATPPAAAATAGTPPAAPAAGATPPAAAPAAATPPAAAGDKAATPPAEKAAEDKPAAEPAPEKPAAATPPAAASSPPPAETPAKPAEAKKP